MPANWGQRMYTTDGNSSPASRQDPVEIRSYHSMSSILSSRSRAPSAFSLINSSPRISGSHQPTTSQRNLSPYAAPFVPQSARRSGSPMLFLPPPFSATSRNVSISSTYPPTSPASPHTPPQRRISSSVSPFAAPVSRRIPVYDDRLSPSLQPQTPAGLPRHGVAAMATHNPFNTAPIGQCNPPPPVPKPSGPPSTSLKLASSLARSLMRTDSEKQVVCTETEP